MRRRQFLATGTTLLASVLAGCGHPPAVLDMDTATDEAIADEGSTLAQPDSEEYSVIASARENGTATRRGLTDLFGHVDVVRVNDSFYDVSETRLEQSEVTVYDVLVDVDPENTTADVGEIAYDDLPAVDRERLGPVITELTPDGGDRYDVGVSYGTAAESNGSVFVPERQYDVVVHEGRRYRIAVDSRTASEATYRYAVTEVAPDVETFADQLRERYRFALTGLSAAEREVVETAIEGTYFEDDEAFRSVVERLREHEGFEVTGGYGTWLVEYEGEEYVTYAEW
jgi:hypothetical protein